MPLWKANKTRRFRYSRQTTRCQARRLTRWRIPPAVGGDVWWRISSRPAFSHTWRRLQTPPLLYVPAPRTRSRSVTAWRPGQPASVKQTERHNNNKKLKKRTWTKRGDVEAFSPSQIKWTVWTSNIPFWTPEYWRHLCHCLVWTTEPFQYSTMSEKRQILTHAVGGLLTAVFFNGSLEYLPEESPIFKP